MTTLRTSTASDLLDRAVRSPARNLDDLASLAAGIATDPLLTDLLETVRDDPSAGAEVARRSYWHHNGFAKIVLDADDDPEGRKLRLHVWPAAKADSDGPRGESDPHGHRWDFASSVLVGDGFDVVEYDVTGGDGDLYGCYEYNPASEDPWRGGIEVHLRPSAFLYRPRGDVYRCSTDITHTVEPRGRGGAATLVVQGRVSQASTWVYRFEPSEYESPVPLTPDEVVDLVDLVLDALGRS